MLVPSARVQWLAAPSVSMEPSCRRRIGRNLQRSTHSPKRGGTSSVAMSTSQYAIVGIPPTNSRARGIDRRVPFPHGWQARRRSLTHDGAESEERARVGGLRVRVFDDQLAIRRCHGWRHGFPRDIGQYSNAHYTHTGLMGDVPEGTAPIASEQASVAGAAGESPRPARPRAWPWAWQQRLFTIEQIASAQRRAAEVCIWVQLSSGSAVYPVRHDVLCVLPA